MNSEELLPASKRVLIVTQKADLDDEALGFAHEWYSQFARHYGSVRIMCLWEGRHHFPENVEVLSLGKEKGASRLVRLVRFYRYVISRRRDYDDVFVHMNPVYVVIAGMLWRLMGKQVSLWYAHGNVSLKLRIAVRFAHLVFTSTPEGMRIDTTKRVVVGQGIDTNRFRPGVAPTDSPFTVVTVGRLSRSKGSGVLVRAFKEFTKNKNSRLLIAGSPVTGEDERYAKEIRDASEGAPIEFVGSVKNTDVPSFLRRAHVFVNIGLTGSLDKAVLEAMAVGVPILSCNEAVCVLVHKRWPDHCISRDTDGVTRGLEQLYALSAQERQAIGREMSEFVRGRFGVEGLVGRIVQRLVHA